YGSTPLHTASYMGHKDMVELLVKSGADVNVKSKAGKTPLDLAKTAVLKLKLRSLGGKSGK
ncbi:MAG: ankyrin repeat domain-containing protein, partial [Spirochaetota bacterium]|nr:ankyrin repeat domain-containing protein [Spirochaetota bacterium]